MANGSTDSEPRENEDAPDGPGDEDRADPEFLENCWSEYAARLPGYFRGRGVGRDALEDLVQETFARMLHAVRNGRVVRDDLRGWIFGIARHLAADYHRARQRAKRLEAYIEDNLPARPRLSEAERRRLVKSIRDAIADLPPNLRTTLELHLGSGRSHQDIGNHLGITRNAVGLRLFRARRLLGRKLSQERPGPQ